MARMASIAWANLALLCVGQVAIWPADPYFLDVLQWRKQHEAALAAEDGWLALAGLHWLEPGRYRIGTSESCDIVLPQGSGPAEAGQLEFASGRAIYYPADGSPPLELLPDEPGPPTRIRAGRVTFWLIRRGDRYGLRVRDPEHPPRRSFQGLCWYPVDPRYRVVGRLVKYDPPRKLRVPSIIGIVTEEESPGFVEFSLEGQQLRLTAIQSGQRLFFVFRDATSGSETYGGGRFLYAEADAGGTVVLDFNKAYHPPCALNPYTTCPLPPEGNRLPVAVRAGEKSCP